MSTYLGSVISLRAISVSTWFGDVLHLDGVDDKCGLCAGFTGFPCPGGLKMGPAYNYVYSMIYCSVLERREGPYGLQ